MNTRQLRHQAISALQQAGIESAAIDVDALLMHCWHRDRKELILLGNQAVPETVIDSFKLLLDRRKNHEPIAYLTGHKEFWSLDFEVNPHVLIPRPETEHMIEHTLELYPDKSFPWRFCDIGTGSGCIAIALATEYPNATLIASDVSAKALKVARRNAVNHDVEQRIHFIKSDVFDMFGTDIEPFHLILSNPPYVSLSAMDDIEQDLHFEPRSALTDEGDGLGIIRKIIRQASLWLQPNGQLIIESGLAGLPKETGDFRFNSYYDLAGQFRGGIYTRNK